MGTGEIKNMTRSTLLLFCLLSLGFSEQPAKSDGTKGPSENKISNLKKPLAGARGSETASGGLKLPEGAVQVGPGTYEVKDAQGRVITYRETPFGSFSKSPAREADDDPGAASHATSGTRPTPFGASVKTPASSTVPTKVTDAGDSIVFERPTPFGPQRWTRKKTELTAYEKLILEQQDAEKK